ncbi:MULTISPECIES: hypothetical protein [unclassified Moraxella]|uniref:hypothetical protein n=1 Tax=unclassified Moraxella TaxID=2685852 RepID=UPI003AF482F7
MLKSLGKFAILVVILGLCGCDRQNQSEQHKQVADYLPFLKSQCSGLHKVTDVDDLVQQMYANIDSTCLFDMPASELEKVWGLKVFDWQLFKKRTTEIDKKKFDEFLQARNKHNKEGKGIYVEIDDKDEKRRLRIVTTESYSRENNNGWGGSLGQGNFPQKLPQPKVISLASMGIASPTASTEHPEYNIIHYFGKYAPRANYLWMNSGKDKQKPVFIITTGVDSKPVNPTLYRTINSTAFADYINN